MVAKIELFDVFSEISSILEALMPTSKGLRHFCRWGPPTFPHGPTLRPYIFATRNPIHANFFLNNHKSLDLNVVFDRFKIPFLRKTLDDRKKKYTKNPRFLEHLISDRELYLVFLKAKQRTFSVAGRG